MTIIFVKPLCKEKMYSPGGSVPANGIQGLFSFFAHSKLKHDLHQCEKLPMWFWHEGNTWKSSGHKISTHKQRKNRNLITALLCRRFEVVPLQLSVTHRHAGQTDIRAWRWEKQWALFSIFDLCLLLKRTVSPWVARTETLIRSLITDHRLQWTAEMNSG